MDLTDKTLGPYKIEHKLGEGGMGAVYKATHRYLGRVVAIKILPPELARDPDFTARFQSEGQAVAALEHPNIVPIYEAGELDGYYFLAMRFINGYSLSDMASRGPISLQQLLPLMEQATAALDVVHARGIVHRDIKPGNLLLEGTHLFLADFGIAKRDSGDFKTRTGMVVGTPEYMAPEQLMGKALDGRADIYALAVLCYQLLAGQVPFAADNPAMVIYRKMSEACPDLRQARPDLPEGVAMVLARAMATKPEDRFATAGEFYRALAAAARGTAMPDVISPMARPSAHDATVVDMPSPAQGQPAYPSPPYGQQAQPEPGYATPPQGQYGTLPQGQYPQGQPYGTPPQGQYAQGQPYGTPPQGQYAQGQPYAADQRVPARRGKLPLVIGIGALLLVLALGGAMVRNRLRATNRATTQPTRVARSQVVVPTIDDILVPTDESPPEPSPDEPPTPEPTREPATLPDGWEFHELPDFGLRLAMPPEWVVTEETSTTLTVQEPADSAKPIRTTGQLSFQTVSNVVDLVQYRELVKTGMAEKNLSFELGAPIDQKVRGLEVKGLSYTLFQKPEGRTEEVALAVLQYFFQHQGQGNGRVFTMTCFTDPKSVETERQLCDDVLASIDFLK